MDQWRTRVYSILAYEKAVRQLQFGPGVAIAFSVAPLMAVLIYMLARFMRADDNKGTQVQKKSLGDLIMRPLGRLMGLFLDVVFLPIELVVVGLGRLTKTLTRGLQGGDDTPMLKMGDRERLSLTMRILILIPIMFFVLFPFYWVVITSFKTTPQIFERANIFWPEPWTFEQYRSLLTGHVRFCCGSKTRSIVAVSSTGISVILAALGAYALSRLKFLGAGLITALLLITYLLPATMLFIPLYQTLTDLSLINTLWRVDRKPIRRV